jgi:catechol 2,3-dioxygenase-like lactoylglutathione lyase family enzyme
MFVLAAAAISTLAACASPSGTSRASSLALTSTHDPSAHAAPVIHSVLGVGITVTDLDTSVAFYRDVLGCELIAQREETGDAVEAITGVFGVRRRTALMRLGDEQIELTDYLAPEGRPLPADFRSNDRWFQHLAIVVADMDRAYAHLRARNVRHASTGPQTLPLSNPNAGGIRAFYFKDPDGHPLELIWFPDAKGDPRWRSAASQNPAALFLGIDHTAIVVADTDASLRFYRDVLGLRVAGASNNIGIEQARLNNVKDAHLRITGLRAQHGMGVELLEYLHPGPGRAYPADAAPNDLLHYETIVGVGDLTGLRVAHTGPADPDQSGPQPEQGMLRDPDGHAIIARRSTPPR